MQKDNFVRGVLLPIFLITILWLAFKGCTKDVFENEDPLVVEELQDTVTSEPVGNTRMLRDDLVLQVQNKKLTWSDGEPCILLHADSPEGRLRSTWATQYQAEATALANMGINCITMTMRGDDACCTSIYPWKTSSASSGVDGAKIRVWKQQIQWFLDECERNNNRGVVILYLGERTNFQSISSADYYKWIDTMAVVFGSGEDITGRLIFGWEEIWNGSQNGTASYINNITSRIDLKMPKALTMYHNNPGQKAWLATAPVLDVDICNLQETSVSAMNTSALSAWNAGYVVHLHELYPGFKTSNSQSTNLNLLSQLLNTASGVTSGYGIFSSDYDGQAPNASRLAYVYQALVAAVDGGNPPPPPPVGNIDLFYSTSGQTNPNRLDSNEVLSIGSYNIFIPNAQGSAPCVWSLKQNGVIKLSKTENSAPWECNGGALYPFSSGNWSVRVETNGIYKELPFVVGTVVPPDTTGNDTIVSPPAGNFVVEYSTQFSRTPSTSLNVGNDNVVITSGSYWWFVRQGSGTFTFTLKKNGVTQTGYPKTDSTPIFDMNGNNNVYFQRGAVYSITVTNTVNGNSVTRTINITVN